MTSIIFREDYRGIIAPILVTEDGVTNFAQQGFNEKQGVELVAALDVDGNVDIAAGTKVDSHLIFLNSPEGQTSGSLLTDTTTWTFSGLILGVMSKRDGSLVEASDSLFEFGDYFTGTSAFNNAGFEGADTYSGVGTQSLLVTMNVTEPGDWIRVITVSEVPVPAALFLFAPALLGLLGLRRKTKVA